MRVAVVLPELDRTIGGGFTFQEALYAGLGEAAQSEHEWIVYSRSDAGDVRMPSGNTHLAATRLIRAARDAQDRYVGIRPAQGATWFERSVRKHAVDFVWFGTPYATETDLPYIFTIWDLQHLEQPWFPELRERGEWERRQQHYTRFVPRAARVIVPNAAGTEQLLRGFPIGRDRVLELAHPTPRFAQEAGDAGDTVPPTAQPYLLYPAQFWAHKNHPTLLRMLTRLPKRYRLVCVGADKGQADHVQASAGRLGVGSRLELRGFVETAELVALYRHAHALVYPSVFGPENLPPLEACALGCPVVQADIPGAREQLGDAALLVPPFDDEAWANAVLSLEDPELRSRLGATGRELAAQRDVSSYIAGVVAFLDEFAAVRECWR